MVGRECKWPCLRYDVHVANSMPNPLFIETPAELCFHLSPIISQYSIICKKKLGGGGFSPPQPPY